MVKNEVKDYQFPLVVISVAIVLALVLILFVGRPLWNGMMQKKSELSQKKEVLAALELKLERLKNLESRKAELQEKNKKVLAALPTDKDVSRLFMQFEKVARDNGLLIKSVTEGAENVNEAGVLKKLAYTVSGDASSYTSFRKSVERFQTALRLLGIDSFNVTKNKDGGQVVSVTFDIVTFARGTE